MNAATRTKLESLLNALDTIKNQIEEIAVNEQDKFDNLPEALQDAERGQALANSAESLQESITELETATDAIDNAMQKVDEATSN